MFRRSVLLFSLLVLSVVLLCVTLIGVGPAAAAPITSIGDMNPGHDLIDFEDFAQGTLTPITTQGVTFSTHPLSTYTVRFVCCTSPYPNEGIYEGVALGHEPSAIFIDFDTPVQEFGMGVIDPSWGYYDEDGNWIGNVVLIKDKDGNLLEQIEVPAAPYSSVFVGCVRTQPDIKRVEFHTDGDPSSIDMVRFFRVIEVELDIKPGSDPNSINLKSKGVIPVAILSTATFDATTVDHTTVTFEGARETHVDKKTGEPRRHEEDVDGDGDTDLVFHFRLGDTGLTCDSEIGMLTGKTYEGQAIQGTDTVRMVPNGEAKGKAKKPATTPPTWGQVKDRLR